MEEVIARDPATAQGREVTAGEKSVGLKRSVGFYGLMFISLGSIIGSGWLLGALNAAKVAGPASILSWTDFGGFHTTRDTVGTVTPQHLVMAGEVATQTVLELAATN